MDYRSVAITGASSGIGAALARAVAREGRAIALIGRDAARLQAVAEACRASGAECMVGLMDVRESDRLGSFLRTFDEQHPVDLLVANAGVLGGRPADQPVETAETARDVLEINLMASVATVHALLPALRRRRRGDVLMVSSLAGFAPLPDAPAYSASKAGMLFYGLALRDALAGDGVRVAVACPGFVTTGMSNVHIGQRPGSISADLAADLILRGLRRGDAVIGFPAGLSWLSRLTLLAPEWVRRRSMKPMRFHVAGS